MFSQTFMFDCHVCVPLLLRFRFRVNPKRMFDKSQSTTNKTVRYNENTLPPAAGLILAAVAERNLAEQLMESPKSAS